MTFAQSTLDQSTSGMATLPVSGAGHTVTDSPVALAIAHHLGGNQVRHETPPQAKAPRRSQ